jgi:hypothetical protein
LKTKRRSRGLRQRYRLKAGSDWHDDDLVFTTSKSTPLAAQNIINRHFKPLLERAGLPLSAGTISGTLALPSFWGAASTLNAYSIFSGTPR